MRALFGFALLLLFGCSDWNQRAEHFATMADFKASRYGDSGHLPSTLLPPSARNIAFTYNIDTTEVEVRFDFARPDAERVMAPFRNPDQVRLNELEKQGALPGSKVTSPAFIRCSGRHVEFLQITDLSKARYWTSADPKLRSEACSIPSPLPDPGPLI